tara:strand:- start:172 stop:498 length:327 start_codon:yes stop_codon:yes gene_type:complete
MRKSKMKKKLNIITVFLIVNLSTPSYAYGISEAVCNSHKMVMNTVISWRNSEIPIQTAKDVFDHEDNYELLFWLRGVVKEVYKDPVAGKKFLDSGLFTKKCIEIHRGY